MFTFDSTILVVVSHTFLHYLCSRIARQLDEAIGTIHNRIAGHLCVAKHKVGICKRENKKVFFSFMSPVVDGMNDDINHGSGLLPGSEATANKISVLEFIDQKPIKMITRNESSAVNFAPPLTVDDEFRNYANNFQITFNYFNLSRASNWKIADMERCQEKSC